VFCSDRSKRFVNCWITPVATLYRCERDGSDLRMLSSNIEHDNTPWPLPDGRFLYMRWEYVDRNQNVFHHLWTANPDGTGQMVYYGNMHPGTAMLDAKPVPGTRQVVASFSPGHGRPEHAGHVTLVDPVLGPDHQASARRISHGGPEYRDPFPVSPNCFLLANKDQLLVMDGKGRTETIYELPEEPKGLWVHEPRPLVPHPRERVIPDRTDRTDAEGTLFLGDIYVGRNMADAKRGDIKELLILEQLPKPVNFSGGMWPISAGGTFTLARILGTVPVRDDGSAHFRAPALRSLFFVALDKDRKSVKRMHSFTTLQPGENTGCVGCHESRLNTPLAARPRPDAMEGEPDAISPVDGIPDVPDFPRDVQPVLDRHCVKCHNPDDYRGKLDLSGDRTPLFSRAYWSLTHRGLYSDGRNNSRGNYPPRQIGSGNSRILAYLDGSHHDAKPTPAEQATVWAWIEAGAPYAGTYAALGSGMAPVTFPEQAMEQRCASCHGQPTKRAIGGRKIGYRFGGNGPALPLVNSFGNLRDIRAMVGYYKFGQSPTPQSLCTLTRPEKSPLLLAHLAKSAGGWERGGKTVFASPDDPDYQTILAAIQAAGDRLAAAKRFDMPDFRPNDYYLYQMERYGILKPGMPENGYVLDRAYWDSFHYRP
jgi:cytochrome c553